MIAWIYSIALGYIYLVKSGNFNVELLIISTANIWELLGLEHVVIARKYQNSRSKLKIDMQLDLFF
jgi:hypothetical protein